MAQPLDNAPDDDEFEINIFGPGYGESIAAHLGGGYWFLNDCCLNQAKTRPAPLEYLERIGIDYGESVRLIVASHWHDDHVRGLSSVVEACPSATFCCSASLQSREFVQLVRASSDESSRLGSGLAEFRRIIQILVERKNRTGSDPLRWASADVTLWRHPELPSISVHSLSPSSASITRSLREIGQLAIQIDETKNRVTPLTPNATSVVTWIDLEDDQIVLGADLEVTPADPNTGWEAICRSNTRPPGRAGVYKVAHHGSATGYHSDMYSTVLQPTPMSVLAPFKKGKVQLPTTRDCERICRNSSAAYSTVLRIPVTQKVRERAVDRMLKNMNVRVETLDPICGQVRLRRRRGETTWKVETSLSAGSICSR